ncbi:uncharacterized protein F4822DRAFT_424899 [Hypoxylon trugodes]|uniref:uncharacterized protein n=1 Tax=Hypoxylon trugodes TaxID=326681 RepID=UPI00219992F7|nr:uncharacterized protein F4822DRAFT_424899 [Hypoxylon trugodes]KAI1394420.1 hypothetical protein F4822DRAFT_424899 [Hypoxylon trugodes]
MQTQPPFFSLPAEIRDRIYEIYLAVDHTDFEYSLRPQLLYLADTPYVRPLPALMLTCKSLYRDLSPIVHKQAVLRVDVSGRIDRRVGFAVHGTLRFNRLDKLLVVIATDYPNWNSWLSFFGEVTKRAENLETLVFDWAPRTVSSSGWEGRGNTRKEKEFLKIIGSLPKLRLIQIYGNVSSEWTNQLEKKVPHAQVVRHSFRWWREPGLD